MPSLLPPRTKRALRSFCFARNAFPALARRMLWGGARRAGAKVVEIAPHVMDALTLLGEPHGLLAVVSGREATLEEPLTGRWVALESVQKAGNLGTILRTAAAAGARGVIAAGENVDFFDPASVRASMGALWQVALVRATPEQLWAQKAREKTFWLGTSPGATISCQETPYPENLVLWMGDERRGLSVEILAACDLTVKIPIFRPVDSINLAVATGVMLYEIARTSATTISPAP